MATAITNDRQALVTGALLGLLLRAQDDGVLNLRAQPAMDEDYNYTNVIELREYGTDTLVFLITVDSAT
jgi:hypothetical protein